MADRVHRSPLMMIPVENVRTPRLNGFRQGLAIVVVVVVIVAALIAVVSGLGGAILRQLDATSETKLRHAADARYALAQLQRETLRLQRRIDLYEINRDRDGTHLQAQLVQSRFNVIRSPVLFNALSPAARASVLELNEEWDELQPAFAYFLNAPTQARAEALMALLEGMELGINRTNVGFNDVLIEAFQHISRTSNALHTNLLISGGALLGFALLGGGWSAHTLHRQHRLHTQLEAARAAEQAERVSRRLQDDFLAHVSHELRHPLYMVIGQLGITQMDTSLSPELSQRLARMRVSAESLLEQMNNLLDSTRTASGQVDVVETVVAIRPLVSQWHQLVAIPLSTRPLTLEVQIAPDMPDVVQVDSELLTRIVVNLLSNAIKYTAQGTITLSIGRDLHPGFWLVRVADTGIGIPPEAHQRIFERFARLKPGTHPPQPGSGLGLYIARAYAEAMGGTIMLESVPGQGSTFTLRLPLQFPSSDVVEGNQ